eukprot:gb/GFBE01050803.1/.p1 GENE.gb/GFBE01050803.1/~~gb/GFBE01050803.1/.p1  ORF type:complete len:159 (+),score=32.94 gb/GFBE01050803.1/:1-477(+)
MASYLDEGLEGVLVGPTFAVGDDDDFGFDSDAESVKSVVFADASSSSQSTSFSGSSLQAAIARLGNGHGKPARTETGTASFASLEGQRVDSTESLQSVRTQPERGQAPCIEGAGARPEETNNSPTSAALASLNTEPPDAKPQAEELVQGAEHSPDASD